MTLANLIGPKSDGYRPIRNEELLTGSRDKDSGLRVQRLGTKDHLVAYPRRVHTNQPHAETRQDKTRVRVRVIRDRVRVRV